MALNYRVFPIPGDYNQSERGWLIPYEKTLKYREGTYYSAIPYGTEILPDWYSPAIWKLNIVLAIVFFFVLTNRLGGFIRISILHIGVFGFWLRRLAVFHNDIIIDSCANVRNVRKSV